MGNTQQCSAGNDCTCGLNFKTEDSYLAPYIGGAPIKPIDLSTLVASAESDTRLQLDQTNRSLVYTGERATSSDDGTPDTVTIKSMAELMQLGDLEDVELGALGDGTLLVYDASVNKWKQYTVPEGDSVFAVGINADGFLVKGTGPSIDPGSVEVPLGGAIIWTLPEADMPSNFVYADGRELNRSVYSELFALMGTDYGIGNGTTTFNIPNFKGRSPIGVDSTQTEFSDLGKTGGAKTHTLTPAQMPAHGHSLSTNGNHGHGIASGGHSIVKTSAGGSNRVAQSGGGQQLQWGGVTISNGGNHSHTVGSAGSGQAHNNLHPFISQFIALRVQ